MPTLFFPEDNLASNRLSKQVAAGRLWRVRPGVYIDTDNDEEVTKTLHQRWHEVVHALCPKGTVAAYRTAHELRPIEGQIFLAAPINRRRKIVIHDSLTLHVLPAPTEMGTEPFVPHLFRSNPARQCLENLSASRGRRQSANKGLGVEFVEGLLSKYLRQYGEQALNELRDEARTLAPVISADYEYKVLSEKISALLATHPADNTLVTSQANAIANQAPYDENRLTLFQQLGHYLQRCTLDAKPFEYNKAAWRHLSFFESYFSNYIEGTEFTLEEAEGIVFSRTEVNNRHTDSHDVLSVFDVVSDPQEMLVVPDSGESLLSLLSERHKLIMAQRPDKRPGEFKTKANQAGNSIFVLPNEIPATLSQAMTVYRSLPPGLARAIFIHFVIGECHPMDDGNGRLARIFLNAELHAVDLHKLIMPTVHRDSYLNGLRRATQQGQFRTMVKVLHQMHLYSAAIPWYDYGESLDTLKADAADQLPDDGIALFNRAISQWRRTYPDIT